MRVDKLEKKLNKLTDMFSDVKASIKMPKISTPKTPDQPKLPGNAPKSKKDPEKMAEQIKNPDLKPKAVEQAKEMKESLKVSKNGQWSL